MTERDKALAARARQMRWEDIDEETADTPEGRAELHRICMAKYHQDEARCGMD